MNTTRGALLHDLVRRIEQLEARVAELEKQKRPARKAADSEK
jgi:chaperonin cofactor prefoldin